MPCHEFEGSIINKVDYWLLVFSSFSFPRTDRRSTELSLTREEFGRSA